MPTCCLNSVPGVETGQSPGLELEQQPVQGSRREPVSKD